MADSKTAQEAEAKARAETGANNAAENLAAMDVAVDEPRGDPGAPAPQKADPEQRKAPPVKAKFDDKRAEIINRFRSSKRNEAEDRDDISDFARSGLPPELAPPAEEPEDQTEPEPAAAAPEPDAPTKIKLKVRGQDMELSLDEVIANAQKALASDNYLDEAKSKLKEVDDLLRSTRNQAPRPGQTGEHHADPNGAPKTEQQQQTEDQDPQHPEGSLDKLVDALQFGDREEATALLQNTIDERANRAAAQAVTQSLQSERLREEGARATKVLQDFEARHPEIANDKKARAAIESDILDYQVEDITALGVDLNRIRPDGQPPSAGDIALAHRWYRSQGIKVRSPSEMLEKATESYLDWKGVKAPTPPNPADPGNKAAPLVVTVDRTARRQAIPQQPGQSGAPPRDPAQTAPQPRDRSAIVHDMRAKRDAPRGRILA